MAPTPTRSTQADIEGSRSIPHLIHHLASHYHDGVLMRMALHSGVGYTTIWRYIQSPATDYSVTVLTRLAHVYRLKQEWIIGLAVKDAQRRIAGRPVPVIETERRRGPVPGASTTRRRTREWQYSRRRKKG